MQLSARPARRAAGCVDAILSDPNGGFAARAITRDPTKDKAKALAAKGAEVVKADLDDVESLKKAFAGAYGVYAVTNFWEHFSGEKEKAQAKNIADAAKAAGVKHVIWSTLEDTRKLMTADDKRMPMLQEKYRVPHFDAKAEADAYFAGLPATFLVTSFYWDNLYMFGLAPKKGDDGVYSWTFPMGDAKLAGHRRRGHRQGRLRHLQGRPAVHRQDRRHRRREPDASRRWATKLAKGLGIGPVQYNARRRGRCTAASDSPARTNRATCSRSTATSKRK